MEPNKTFLGVRFVLFGFDPTNEHEVRAKLVDGGGVDVGQLNRNCTHVIVDKLVYDNPICVAARKNGKTVVTGLWVDHSFDIELQVDVASIMYRPLRDLNGIPGAKDLIMCLTGYQRQDRDDVMTMVSLMGAQFSKPLVATKVTHLICYKFEGEKYELAKKLKKIKLVNHRWLEDCLRDWELLPEADYNKSGYELEKLEAEAEAKDSEDEAEDGNLKSYGSKQVNKSPHTPSVATTGYELKSTDHKETLSNVAIAKIPTNEKEDSSPQVQFDNVNVPLTNDCQGTAAFRDATAVNLPDPLDKSPVLTKVEKHVASTSRSSKRSPKSDAMSGVLMSYSREPHRKSSLPLPLVSVQLPSNAGGSIDANLGAESAKSVGTPENESFSHQEKESGVLPQKRVTNGSNSSSKLQKTSSDAKTCVMGSPSAIFRTKDIEATALAVDLLETVKHVAPGNDCCTNQATSIDMTHNSSSSVSMINSSSDKKLMTPKTPLTKPTMSALENTRPLQTSPRDSKDSTSASKLDCGDMQNERSAQRADETLCLQVERQDAEVSLPKDREIEVENGRRPCSSGSPPGRNDKLVSKPTRKKAVAKKTLGSRPKVSKNANQKGSMYSWKSLSKNDSATFSNGKDDRAEVDKSVNANVVEVETPHQTLNTEAPNKLEAEAPVNFGDNIVNDFEYVDDDTEPPEENHECEVENKLDEKKSAEIEMSHVAETSLCKKLEVHNSDDNEFKADDIVAAEEETSGTKPDNAVSSGKSDYGETNFKGDSVAEKVGKVKKQSTGKTKNGGSGDGEKVEKGKKQTTGKTKNGDSGESNFKGDGGEEKVGKDKKQSTGKTKNGDSGETNFKGDSVEEKVGKGKKQSTGKTKNSNYGETNVKGDGVEDKVGKGKKQSTGKTKVKTVPTSRSKKSASSGNSNEKKGNERGESLLHSTAKDNHALPTNKLEKTAEVDKENPPLSDVDQNSSLDKRQVAKSKIKSSPVAMEMNSHAHSVGAANRVKNERMCFILTGHKLQRKDMQQVIRRLRGRFCSDSHPHKWSYQATHFICPEPIRRIEKFFAAAASGRWILKTDYLTASNEAGKLLDEEPYEWHKKGFTEDGSVNLEAPRKWRLLRETTGHGAFHGMRIIVYGECIAPTLDTLKRVVKAGDGTILATSPPYTRFLKSGVDFAVVSPGMPHVDIYVQEFLKHEIPCVTTDYLVEYICKPGCSLEKHVLFNTRPWAEKSLANMQNRAEEVIVKEEFSTPVKSDDVPCEVCGSHDRGEVMLLCRDESGSIGCGVGTHIDCCDPPLDEVPEEDWFCPKCRGSSGTKSSNKKRKTSVLKCR